MHAMHRRVHRMCSQSAGDGWAGPCGCCAPAAAQAFAGTRYSALGVERDHLSLLCCPLFCPLAVSSLLAHAYLWACDALPHYGMCMTEDTCTFCATTGFTLLQLASRCLEWFGTRTVD